MEENSEYAHQTREMRVCFQINFFFFGEGGEGEARLGSKIMRIVHLHLGALEGGSRHTNYLAFAGPNTPK